jgi:hypothetical protein
MPKSNNSRAPPPDERRLQKGHVVVTKFLSYLKTTNSEGFLVLKTIEDGTPALLTITSGESWVSDAESFISRPPKIVTNLRAKDCVMGQRRDFRKENRPSQGKAPWFAKLPIDGLLEKVYACIDDEEVPHSQQVLQESVASYFKTGVDETRAVERLKACFELAPVPSDAYLEFPPI